MVKMILKKYFPNFYAKTKNAFFEYIKDFAYTKSYSQEAEDLVLNKFLGNKKDGFYVDVGAHHPVRFSNTLLFYKKGWKGINIDAMPGSMEAFKKNRKNDINLEIPISAETKKLKYYIFQEKAYNTFSGDLAKKYSTFNHLMREELLATRRLADVLEEYVPAGKKIDFLTIDVEGLDLEVLSSNDWRKFIPDYIIVEDHGFDLENPGNSMVYSFLKEKGYFLISKIHNSLLFCVQKK